MQLNYNEAVSLWWHYEQIAMHFNELIIQYRLQLMGGAGAIGTLATYVIGSKVSIPERRHTIRAYVTTVIFVLLTAAAALDVFYYDKLLHGAVDAFLLLEKSHPEIIMSTRIDQEFPNHGYDVIYFVYGIILIPLFIFTFWPWIVFISERTRNHADYRNDENTDEPQGQPSSAG